MNKLKDSIRKFIVSLKRNPSVIPLVMMFFTFLYYSLNLTDVSDTTAKIQGGGMGLSQFCIMLFSLLSLVCLLNAFPRRKKPNILMLVVFGVMAVVIFFCDIHYCNRIVEAVYRPENPVSLTDNPYIRAAYDMLNVHKVLMVVSAVLVALLPVYSKLLRKINTSIDVEGSGDIGTIEIADEE